MSVFFIFSAVVAENRFLVLALFLDVVRVDHDLFDLRERRVRRHERACRKEDDKRQDDADGNKYHKCIIIQHQRKSYAEHGEDVALESDDREDQRVL